MTAIKRRNRLLALRLTEEEYERLKSACLNAGGHNLSEFTRAGLLSLVEAGSSGLAEKLSSLESRIADVQLSIQNLICHGAARSEEHDRQS